MEAIITLKDIARLYTVGTETIYALRSITTQVNKNEYVALMGSSGSGKSTLMNIIGCLDTPSGGEYHLKGINVSQMTDNALAEIRESAPHSKFPEAVKLIQNNNTELARL